MTRVLHIQATLRGQESYSLRTAQAFLESYLDSYPGDEVETVDLAKGELPEFDATAVSGKYRLLAGYSPTGKEAETWKAIEATIGQLKSAHKLVLSSPMWNFGIPYRLKQYFDVIVQPGYTFSYSSEDGYKGLVTGRPAMLILARGGEYAPGTDTAPFDLQLPYLECILRFIGFTKIDSIVIEPTLQRGSEVAGQKLAEAIAAARAKAKTF